MSDPTRPEESAAGAGVTGTAKPSTAPDSERTLPMNDASAPPPASGDAAEPAAAASDAAPEAKVPPPRPKPRFPALVRAWRSHRPVEGQVVQVIKGGYEVRVGKARAFCPH